MEWANTIVQGVLTGGLYAMFAAGLSLIFGVMRLVNIAHGDFIVLAAYLALVVIETLGVDPLVSLLIVVPLMAAIGYALQRGLLNRTLGRDLLHAWDLEDHRNGRDALAQVEEGGLEKARVNPGPP